MIPHGTERCDIVERVVDVELQELADLRGVFLPLKLGMHEGVIGIGFTVILKLLRVVTQCVDQIVVQLPVALPRVAQKIQG
ncbi:hypothetical protein R69746_08707 [Paraburkholderia aspalathi]|nr:hypothetical protein R69746_08707 [Paraburkholderia aspalathi]